MAEIFEDEGCLITFERGTNANAVISFSGIGYGVGGIQTEEFRKSLNAPSERNSVYYVRDKNRHWYNSSFFKIVDVLSSEIRTNGFEEVYTLGHSMGGFGAALFAGSLPNCVRSISFGAQCSVHPKYAPFERRFDSYTRSITNWVVPDLPQLLSNKIEYLLFYGSSDARDMQHAARFNDTTSANVIVVIVDGCTHEVARFLRDKHCLQSVLPAVLDSRARFPETLFDCLAGVSFSVLQSPIGSNLAKTDGERGQIARPVTTPLLELKFGLGGNASALQGEGWANDEAGFVWSIGGASRLTVPIPPGVRLARLQFQVIPHLSPPVLQEQRLTINVDDEQLAYFVVDSRGSITCIIPGRLMENRTHINLVLTHPDARSPADLGRPEDPRPLAIAFSRLLLWGVF